MAAYPPLRGSREVEVSNLISQGKFEEAIGLYYSGVLTSALEHHWVFVALCATRAPEFRLRFVETKARKDREGYKKVALDFERDWALYYAEVKNDLPEARRRINLVTKEGGTDLQIVLGLLADGKIRLREGAIDEALDHIDEARNTAYALDLPDQVLSNCDWWYDVVLSLAEKYPVAARLARIFRSNERKSSRRWSYLAMGWLPLVGPRVMRRIYMRQLGL